MITKRGIVYGRYGERRVTVELTPAESNLIDNCWRLLNSIEEAVNNYPEDEIYIDAYDYDDSCGYGSTSKDKIRNGIRALGELTGGDDWRGM